MVDSAAACARGRARSSRSRTQGEAFGGAKGEPEDADPAPISCVIRVRAVVGPAIYDSAVATEATRQRLSPSTFRLPVERIREGYYSDAYLTSRRSCSRR